MVFFRLGAMRPRPIHCFDKPAFLAEVFLQAAFLLQPCLAAPAPRWPSRPPRRTRASAGSTGRRGAITCHPVASIRSLMPIDDLAGARSGASVEFAAEDASAVVCAFGGLLMQRWGTYGLRGRVAAQENAAQENAAQENAAQENANKKGLANSPSLFMYLVAGAGFEPTTFGL